MLKGRNFMRNRAVRIAVVAGSFAGAMAVAGPAVAAQEEFVLTCGEETVTLRANESNSAENGGWSVAQIRSEGGGHLIPVRFAGTFENVTQAVVYDEFAVDKGRGNANRNQATVTCTETFAGVWEEFAEDGDELPPGAVATDTFRWTFTVTAVQR